MKQKTTIKRLWADPQAEVLETMPRLIQRQWGFRPYQVKRKVSRRNPRYDYQSIAKRLGEFTFEEIKKASKCEPDNLYRWLKRMVDTGNIAKRKMKEKHGNRNFYRWIGK